jgi:16S rRNA (cytosine967-C5)-methyltransferase
MPISPARVAAFDILLRVEQGAYAVELLHSERLDSLSPADRGLCTEIVMGVERWRSRLDDAVAPHLSQSLSRLDREVLLALRMAAYQLLFLERVPAHAAINESVELVKRARKRSAAGLVNAVLRKLAKEKSTAMGEPGVKQPQGLPSSSPRPHQEVAKEFAHPEWLVARWITNYGAAAAQRICEFDQQVPATAIRLRPQDDADLMEHELTSEGVQVGRGLVVRSARRVISGDVTKTRAFLEHRIAIQDEASQLVAAVVGHGRRVLDCCAAPGGKTAAIADQNPEAEILAVEVYEHRAHLLRKLVSHPNVSFLHADARQIPEGKPFDRVLVDAPCSGSGTLTRNPEIKWRLQPGDLAELQRRQIEILLAAADHTESGGRLIYATCSLEPEEGEQVIVSVLANRSDLKLLNIASELERLRDPGELVWPNIDSLIRGSFLRTIPGVHPCDGFFAAILESKKNRATFRPPVA